MKKLLALLVMLAMLLPSCQKINDRIDGLEDRIDQIEGTQIATINQQIEAINTTLPQLRETDAELKEYIKSLQTTATNLQEQITNTNDDIDELEDALDQAIDDANNTLKSELLSQLQTVKTALEAELAQINSTIATLQAKDVELEGKITTLEEYVNTELQNTEDWATATFATLEQYNTIVDDIATIKTQIEALNTSLANLEERLNTKIATDIATAVEGLQGELATKVTEITTAYANAISTAKEEITAAYTEAIATAITNLESSMKQWVNEQLTGYYTIAECEAKLAVLKADLEAQLAAQKTYCESLITALANNMTSQVENIQKQIDAINKTITDINKEIESLYSKLEQTKAEITTAYTEAIAKAIEENEGKWSEALTNEIEALNERIDKSDVAAIEQLVANCKSRMETIEKDVAQLKTDVLQLQENVEKLLVQIQSISYVPKYSDGMATMDYANKTAVFDFIVSPKDAVSELANVWHEVLSMMAIYTQTRAIEFIELPITKFESDSINGVISLTVSGENLSDDFYCEQQDASAFLKISDGNSNITSDYIAMTPNYNIQFEDLNVKAICCKNWDTNNDGELSYSEAAAVTDIETVFKGNTSIIAFTEFKYFTGLTEIPSYAFSDCESLWKIELPSSIIQIGVSAFQNCESIRYIDIPYQVEVIGEMSFKDCISINRLQIPDSVLIIKDEAFLGCIGVEEVVLGKNVSIIASKAFYNCSTISNIIFGENLITIGDNAFNGCSSIAELNIPNSVTTIEDGAFRYCKGLQKLYIPSSVTTLGVNITELCTGELFIDCDIPNGEKTYYSSGSDTVGFSSVFNRSNFTKVIFGDNVRYVGQYSFSLCHNLTTLEFGENITEISGYAFHADNDNHGRISTVFVKSMVPPYQSNSFHQWYWGYSYGYYYTKMPSDLTIYVPRIAEDNYKAQWSVYSDKIVGYDFE